MRWGAYIHVPWCRARCPYCAFYVVPGADPPSWRPFVDRVLAEGRARAIDFSGPASTVYLGGGTPSRLPGPALAALIAGVPHVADAEISAEANPEDVTEAWLDQAIEAGIHRLSLGVQSFVQPIARRLGRGHTSPQALEVCHRIRTAGLRSWSIDLIFAVPGQTLDDLDRDLSTILSLGAPHVSIYGLTIEPGTRFAQARALPTVDDDTWRSMYDRIVARLSDAGIHRYEVSSFARSGHACQHNQLYWTDHPYMGLGPGAHGYTPAGHRWHNAPDLAAYLTDTGPPHVDARPTPTEAATDLLVSGLRGIDGVSVHRLAERTGLAPDPHTIRILVDGGLLVPEGDRLRLTPTAFPLADGVVARILDTLQPAGTPGEPSALG